MSFLAAITVLLLTAKIIYPNNSPNTPRRLTLLIFLTTLTPQITLTSLFALTPKVEIASVLKKGGMCVLSVPLNGRDIFVFNHNRLYGPQRLQQVVPPSTLLFVDPPYHNLSYPNNPTNPNIPNNSNNPNIP